MIETALAGLRVSHKERRRLMNKGSGTCAPGSTKVPDFPDHNLRLGSQDLVSGIVRRIKVPPNRSCSRSPCLRLSWACVTTKTLFQSALISNLAATARQL